jgi:hypothetical protein
MRRFSGGDIGACCVRAFRFAGPLHPHISDHLTVSSWDDALPAFDLNRLIPHVPVPIGSDEGREVLQYLSISPELEHAATMATCLKRIAAVWASIGLTLCAEDVDVVHFSPTTQTLIGFPLPKKRAAGRPPSRAAVRVDTGDSAKRAAPTTSKTPNARRSTVSLIGAQRMQVLQEHRNSVLAMEPLPPLDRVASTAPALVPEPAGFQGGDAPESGAAAAAQEAAAGPFASLPPPEVPFALLAPEELDLSDCAGEGEEGEGSRRFSFLALGADVVQPWPRLL